jgi:hypothetical protein
MFKELLEREGWGLCRPRLPKSLEQDPGFEPSANRSQGFGPGHPGPFARLGLLFFPRPLAFQEPGEETGLEPWAALPRGREHGDTSKRKMRSRRAANAVVWPDHS